MDTKMEPEMEAGLLYLPGAGGCTRSAFWTCKLSRIPSTYPVRCLEFVNSHDQSRTILNASGAFTQELVSFRTEEAKLNVETPRVGSLNSLNPKQ